MRRSPYTKSITFKCTPFLYSELMAEAWESGMELNDYVRTLLSSRGKYARMVGLPGNYLIGVLKEQAKLLPRKPRRTV